MKAIFITGESGTIPMAIQRIVVDKHLTAIVNSQLSDNFDYDKYKTHQSFKIRKPEIDFLNRELLFKIFKEKFDSYNEITHIIHSGAYVGTDFCAANPLDAIRTNIEGTKNIVDICNTFNIKLIYFSTTAIFDPKDYSEDKPITENTKINPQTLYGITKYAGEMIVEKECKALFTIVRPVFGFSDYPDDLHSALTKIIYNIIYNLKNNTNIKLDVLLNRNINKSYTRVENIADCVLNIIRNDYFLNVFNIGINYKESVDWYYLFEVIKDEILVFQEHFENLQNLENIYSNIVFYHKKDYLHYHNIDDAKLFKYGLSFKNDLRQGIRKTIYSCIKNLNIKPYWI